MSVSVQNSDPDRGLLHCIWPIQGSVCGSSYWRECSYSGDSEGPYQGYVDTSETVTRGGKDYHPVYYKKFQGESWLDSFLCSLSIVIYAPFVIGYHLARIALVTAYLVGRLLFYDSWASKESFCTLAGRRFVQLGKEWWRSLSTIIRTPICAVGFLLSHIYVMTVDSMQWTHGDALNGRKMAAAYERAWNRWIPLDKSLWLDHPANPDHYEFEGGGDPDHLGESAYYLPGCYQPVAYAEMQGETITGVVTDAGNFKLKQSATAVRLQGCCCCG